MHKQKPINCLFLFSFKSVTCVKMKSNLKVVFAKTAQKRKRYSRLEARKFRKFKNLYILYIYITYICIFL